MSNNFDNPKDAQASEQWFICKRDTGICEIVKIASKEEKEIADSVETWGGFTSQGEAIAKRIGLIRAGKCQPL
ncbi:MAG: DDE transposase family protein [Pseudanabaena frigida]|uniref:DDE transposase family protein n=1 Tax=Pseudanabaena frigida TaxID=945775 RepID=A0A2W4WJ70_9CYAN|nr:MAG: DDE transposase family protein [Pseudanabaena frigida]